MARISRKARGRRTHIQARLFDDNPYDEAGVERAALDALERLNKRYGSDREMVAQALIALAEKHFQGWRPVLKHDAALEQMTRVLDGVGDVLILLSDIAEKLASGEIIAPAGYQERVQAVVRNADPRFAELGVPIIDIDVEEEEDDDEW